MNPSDAAVLLAAAATIDARLTPPSPADAMARAQAWAAALDDDLPPQEAAALILLHYQDSTETVMPAHVNRAWRERCLADRERRRMDAMRRSIADASSASAGPTPEFQAEVRRLFGRPG